MIGRKLSHVHITSTSQGCLSVCPHKRAYSLPTMYNKRMSATLKTGGQICNLPKQIPEPSFIRLRILHLLIAAGSRSRNRAKETYRDRDRDRDRERRCFSDRIEKNHRIWRGYSGSSLAWEGELQAVALTLTHLSWILLSRSTSPPSHC